MNKKVVLVDSNSVKSLLFDNNVDIELLNYEIIIPQQVYDDFSKKNFDLIKSLKSLERKKLIKIHDIVILTEEFKLYKSLVNGTNGVIWGKCESSAISIAVNNSAYLLSDNKKPIKEINNYSLNWITIDELIN